MTKPIIDDSKVNRLKDIIEGILKDAETEVARTVDDIIDTIRDAAWDAGYDKGWEEGYAAGKNDGITETEEKFYKKEKVKFT